MSSLTPALEHFEHNRGKVLDALKEQDAAQSDAARSALEYFRTTYGQKKFSGKTLDEHIAQAYITGHTRAPFQRDEATQLTTHVHPKTAWSRGVFRELFHPWEFHRCLSNIDGKDTDQAIDQSMRKWIREYTSQFNIRSTQRKNHITFVDAAQEEGCNDFLYDRNRVLETVAKTGMIHWEKIDTLFRFTEGLHPNDEMEINGAYMSLCVRGAANSLTALWKLGIYLPSQNETLGDVDRKHQITVHDMMPLVATTLDVRCKFGVVLDLENFQTYGRGDRHSPYLFDDEITIAIPNADSVLNDLDSFTTIKDREPWKEEE